MKTAQHAAHETIDESAESEITIHADGRVFAFGITAGLAEVLATIPTSDQRMKRLLERISRLKPKSADCEVSPSIIEGSPSCPSPLQ
jgi:hypothetical protein